MRKLINIIIIFMLFAFASTAIAGDQNRAQPRSYKSPEPTIAAEEQERNCLVTLVNNTDKTYVFWLAWIDHPFLHQTWGKPWNKVVAEMNPGESFTAENQSPGLYTIKYQEAFHSNLPMMVEDFTITAKDKTIIAVLIPEKNKPPILIIFKYDT